jgi:hypothetical protein
MDVLVLIGVAGFLYGLVGVAGEWTAELHPSVPIDLDAPWALPRYTFFSLSRGLVAYLLSLGFTLVYGYWAAKDRVAERVLVPLLDILQSIPVLSFLPGLVLALIAVFPSTNLGLELAAILMIFTGQAWNMTFSYYHALRSVPQYLREVATVYRLSGWQRLKWLELPYATMGLVWNSMMSMAGAGGSVCGRGLAPASPGSHWQLPTSTTSRWHMGVAGRQPGSTGAAAGGVPAGPTALRMAFPQAAVPPRPASGCSRQLCARDQPLAYCQVRRLPGLRTNPQMAVGLPLPPPFVWTCGCDLLPGSQEPG